jgi:hypothetical protein
MVITPPFAKNCKKQPVCRPYREPRLQRKAYTFSGKMSSVYMRDVVQTGEPAALKAAVPNSPPRLYFIYPEPVRRGLDFFVNVPHTWYFTLRAARGTAAVFKQHPQPGSAPKGNFPYAARGVS